MSKQCAHMDCPNDAVRTVTVQTATMPAPAFYGECLDHLSRSKHHMSTQTKATPRIYVASLADYNNGRLHGVWIDVAGKDAEEIEEEVREMLRGSKYPNVVVECPYCAGEKGLTDCTFCHGQGSVESAEEWAIHDYEGFHGLRLSEYEAFPTIAALAEMIDEHGPAFAAWVDNGNAEGLETDEWAEAFQEAYVGEFASLEEWAEDFLEQTGFFEGVSEHIRNYFNVEAWARDAQLGGDIWTAPASPFGVHVFWNN